MVFALNLELKLKIGMKEILSQELRKKCLEIYTAISNYKRNFNLP
jgi:hypothetical protein